MMKLLILLAVGCAAFDVNGMMQLDFIKNDGTFVDVERVRKELILTKEMGFDGVMCDVWWGIVETAPKVYKWTVYKDLVEMVHALGLKFQPVMSFHQCGGNVGDTCSIFIPKFVRDSIEEKQAVFYLYDESMNFEYINFFIDDMPLDEQNRTPLDMYYDFMKAFNDEFADYIAMGTIDEIQVGTGPCGETRYPSYPGALGWEYPEIGEFVVNDKYAKRSLEMAAAEAGHPEWASIPQGVGSLKTKSPEAKDATFFHKEYKEEFGGDHFTQEKGQFFLKWYAMSMVNHTDRVMSQARRAFGTKMPLANKVAGIHWWFHHESRAGEATSGYVVLKDKNGNEIFNTYTEIAEVLKKHGSRMTFTCMEMYADASAKSDPPALIEYVFNSAPGIELRGENALEVVWTDPEPKYLVDGKTPTALGVDREQGTYKQLLKQISNQSRLTGITLLRLQKYMFEFDIGYNVFSEIVAHAKKCGGKQPKDDCVIE